MKMPERISPSMFAPCGMNCQVCYKHCDHKKPCAGCLNQDQGKPTHCRACKMKDCVQARGCSYCFECPEYPCRQIRNLEKSYHTRYAASLTENSRIVKEQGLEAFLEQQKERYECPECGGVISLHDRECSECRTSFSSHILVSNVQEPEARERTKLRTRAGQKRQNEAAPKITVSDLQKIPGVGANMEKHLHNIGIRCIADLKGKDPEELYILDSQKKGFQDDKCVLYVYRCAVYFAEHEQHEPEKLKWWYWKDKGYPE